MVKLEYNGKFYSPGQFIPEWLYEDYIDYANYNGGSDLKETLIWDPNKYKRGFVTRNPEGNNNIALALRNDGKYVFIGEFDDDELFEEDEADVYSELIEKADKASPREGIDILRRIYLEMDEPTEAGRVIANDPDCIQLFKDYWAYVCWSEHGNQCCLSEIMLDGFISDILDPSYVIDYLLYDDEKKIDKDAKNLIDRYRAMHKKYIRFSRVKNESKKRTGKFNVKNIFKRV